MPTIYLHYKFGCHILNNLAKNQQKKIQNNIEYYNMFNQGFDNLYYHYKLFYYKNFGVKAHKKNLDIFFNNLITYIKNNNMNNDYSIVYGFINHLTMDTLIHPYINYMVKYLNIPHTKIEFMLDSYLYTKYNDTKWDNKIYKTLMPRLHFNSDLKDLLDDVFYKTYNEKSIGKIFNTSHNNGYFIYRYLINDYNLHKASFYKLFDIFSKDIKFSQLTFSFKDFDERVLNSNKDSWHHPNNDQEIYNYSFMELYNIVLKICIKLNTIAYNILHNNLDINELLNLIKNLNLQNKKLLLQ